jgi:hypothetical protein
MKLSNQQILAQAARYGHQIAQLEDLGLKEDRKRGRKAWVSFRRQFSTDLSESKYQEVVDAYWDAYCE